MRLKCFLISILYLLKTNGLQSQTTSIKQYIDSFKNIAMLEMIEYKIPASITLAQGLLESGSGNSRLAKEGNNHFGIKCKKDWTGCTILEDDDAIQECFRCYSKAEDSYKDHSRFLTENKRYAALFTYELSDYKAWAKGLLKAGYATNPKYADLLIGTIERNRLMQFDSMVLAGYNPLNPQINKTTVEIVNNVPAIRLAENQTIEEVAELNNTSERRLNKYNELDQNRIIQPGDVLYLRPKKRKASVASHQVQSGETMWTISQKYAIKVHVLYKKNLMEEGTEPKQGVVLHLQNKASSRPDTIDKQQQFRKENITVNKNTKVHKVASGETLYSISKKYEVGVSDIKKWNNLSSDQLQLGQELIIESSNRTTNNSFSTHIVQKGETLYSIAMKYGVKIEEIKLWNNLQSENLSVGQTLKLQL